MDMDLENIFLNEYVSLHSFLIYESWMKIEQFAASVQNEYLIT